MTHSNELFWEGKHLDSKCYSVCCVILLFLFSAATAYANDESIVYDPDLSQPETYWLSTGWTHGNGRWNSNVSNGVAYLYVNDLNDTGWTGAKIQQGIMPHNWNRSHPLRINPIVNSTTNFKIEVKLRLSNVTFNTAVNETWVNVGVSLWMQRPNTDWNSSDPQLEVGLKLFWLRNGEPQHNPVHFQGDLGNDYHSLFDVYNESASDIGKWIEIEFDAQPYTSQALERWKIESATLWNVEVYLETKGGAGSLEIDYIQICLDQPIPEFTNHAFILILLAISTILIFKLMKRQS
jgi:hypothetical protein